MGDDEVHDVLLAIGAEGELARLEGRLNEVEGELERATTRLEEGERARRGELDLMRARIEDAVAALEATTEEQRASWSTLESRLAEVIAEVEGGSNRLVTSLRDDLSPKVHRAGVRADEVEADLRGEVESAVTEVGARLDALASQLADLRSAVHDRRGVDEEHLTALRVELEGLSSDLRAEFASRVADVHGRVEDLSGRMAELRSEFGRRVDEVRDGGGSAELRGELERLRSDIDATAAELRGEVKRLLDERLAGLHLEDWERALREAAQRLEGSTGATTAALERERAARDEATRSLRGRLDEIATRMEQVDARAVGQVSRHLNELSGLHRHVEELGGRVEVLHRRVTEAVEGVSGDLANRVSALSAELEAVRDSGLRHGERLAGTDRLLRRLADLEARQEALTRSGAGGNGADPAIGRLQRDLASLVERLAAIEERDAAHAARLDEVEAVARAAGKAIAAALRRSRESSPAGSEPLTA